MVPRSLRSCDRPLVVAGGLATATLWVAAVLAVEGLPAGGWSSADLWTGLAVLAAGGLVAWFGSSPAVGMLLIATGASWFVGNFADVETAAIGSLATTGRFVHRGLLAAAVILVRRPRASAKLTTGLIAVLVVSTLSEWLMRQPAGMVCWAASVAVVAAASARRRPWVTGLPELTLTATVVAVAIALHRASSPSATVVHAYEAGVAMTAGLIVMVVADERRRRRRVGDAVVEVALGPATEVRRLIGDALGDGAVDVAFVVDDGWVDEFGHGRHPLRWLPGRAVVDVRVVDRLVAQFSCEQSVVDQSEVTAAIERATALVAANARLRAAARREADELDASRRRLLVATGEQRVQLTAELERATGPLLAELDSVLDEIAAAADGEADAIVGVVRRRAAGLRGDLRALASGLGPTELVSGDLPGALRSLVGHAGIPASIEIDPADSAFENLSNAVSTALYFVAAEAVSNTVKHAGASSLGVRLSLDAEAVSLEVADDGAGGVAMTSGSGLRGLDDRVAGFGGTLDLASPPGQGTVVRAVLPRLPAGPGQGPDGGASPILSHATP